MKTKPIDAILAAFPESEPQFIYRVVCEKSRVDLSFDKESFANANGLQDLLANDKAIAQRKSKQEQNAKKQIKLAVIGVVIAVIVYLFLLFMK